jgi:hypothetical protein
MGTVLDYKALQCEKGVILGRSCFLQMKLMRKVFKEDPISMSYTIVFITTIKSNNFHVLSQELL